MRRIFFLYHDWVKRLMCLSGSVHFVLTFLILWIMITDAVLLGCFGLYGSQDRKNGVTWYFGTWMGLRIESYAHAAKCQSLQLVSLNQLQTRGLELVKVLSFFFMATQTCNISMVGNIYGLLMVLRRNEKSWCVSCLVRISVKPGCQLLGSTRTR
uniref:Uncharacterized protein n=1 Tax=Brassica oleracea var. oleracea TaxID=109376 RepID=A0A0D3E1J9_BRAOL